MVGVRQDAQSVSFNSKAMADGDGGGGRGIESSRRRRNARKDCLLA